MITHSLIYKEYFFQCGATQNLNAPQAHYYTLEQIMKHKAFVKYFEIKLYSDSCRDCTNLHEFFDYDNITFLKETCYISLPVHLLYVFFPLPKSKLGNKILKKYVISLFSFMLVCLCTVNNG